MKQNKLEGFSLIELSIVLIIIGLVMAGITGGASLIQSAKVIGMMNELRSYDVAVNTFYAARGRLPGDVGNLGTFGYQTFTSTSFPPPYSSAFSFGNMALSAPFIDLYLEGVIDFKPEVFEGEAFNKYALAEMGIIPLSQQNKSYFYYMATRKVASVRPYLQNIDLPSNEIVFEYRDDLVPSLPGDEDKSGFIKAKIVKQVDVKMDDGLYNSGKLRSSCLFGDDEGYNSYDDSISVNGGCREIRIIVDLK